MAKAFVALGFFSILVTDQTCKACSSADLTGNGSSEFTLARTRFTIEQNANGAAGAEDLFGKIAQSAEMRKIFPGEVRFLTFRDDEPLDVLTGVAVKVKNASQKRTCPVVAILTWATRASSPSPSRHAGFAETVRSWRIADSIRSFVMSRIQHINTTKSVTP